MPRVREPGPRGTVRPTGVDRAMPVADGGALRRARADQATPCPIAVGAPPRCSVIASTRDASPSSVAGSAMSARRLGGTERTRAAPLSTTRGSARAEEAGSRSARFQPIQYTAGSRPMEPGRQPAIRRTDSHSSQSDHSTLRSIGGCKSYRPDHSGDVRSESGYS